MFKYIYDEDIAYSDVDLIINASNGIGWMGGKQGIKTKLKGVAESIHFASKGEVEKLAKSYCRKHNIFGLKPTSTFITEAPNLKAKNIMHCVTMRYPGSKAKFKTIEFLINKMIAMLDIVNKQNTIINTIAIPFLGCGTGGIDKELVRKLYEEKFQDRPETFLIYEYSKTENNGQSILGKRKYGENVMTKKEISKQEKSLLAKKQYGGK